MAAAMNIGSRTIGDDTKAYVIAEVGHNHQGNLQTCMNLFKAAKEAGVDAVKLQKRDNRTLYSKAMFDRPYDNENSYGATYGAHREALEFGLSEYRELQAYCRELDVQFFATAFDMPSADFLAGLDMPAYKIASGDLKNTPLLRHVASIGKPMIMSTGGATMDDVHRAWDAVSPINSQVSLLQCTAGYPAEWHELDLRVIGTYREAFPGAVVGFSGHDNGIAIAVAAYVLGARIIEKHFTLNRAWKGTDHAFSLEAVGMRKMVRDLERTWLAMGDAVKKVYPSEVNPILKMGKSLVASQDITPGTILSAANVTMKSPAGGLPPYEWDRIIGRTAQRPIAEDAPITLDDLLPATSA